MLQTAATTKEVLNYIRYVCTYVCMHVCITLLANFRIVIYKAQLQTRINCISN